MEPVTSLGNIPFSTITYEQGPTLGLASPSISQKKKNLSKWQFVADWEDDEIVNADMSTQPIALAFQFQAMQGDKGEVTYCSTGAVDPPREDMTTRVEEDIEVIPVAEASTSRAKAKGNAEDTKAPRPRTRAIKPEAPPTRVSKRKQGLSPGNEGLPTSSPSSKRRKYAVPANPVDARDTLKVAVISPVVTTAAAVVLQEPTNSSPQLGQDGDWLENIQPR